MKKVLLSLLLLTGLSFAASAQNDAIYVYRNDGSFNAFLKADVDSVVPSRYDADSLLHAEWQMQVVYTPDSIYRIPLESIDSVSFVAPPTIVNANVFELTAAHDAYLSECDTVRFTLSLNTPAEMRPSRGNVVVSTYDCLSFPDGIMARVLSKTQDESGIHYNCERVGLEDVYEQLVFIGEGYAEEPVAGSRQAVGASFERELWNKEWTRTLEKGGTSTTLRVGDAARMIVTLNIRGAKVQYFSLELTNELTSSVTFNATSSFEKWYEKELAKVTLPRIRIPQCPLLFLTPKLKLSGYFAEGATVSMDCSAHFNRTDRVKYEYKDNRWSAVPRYSNNAGIDVASLSMTGYTEVGLIPDLFFSINGSATGLGIECTVGVKESVDFKFDAVAAFDEGMYDALKDSYARTTMPWSVRAYAQVGLFGNGVQPASVKISGEPQIGTNKYLLPLFSKPEYQEGAVSLTAVLKTQPSRDLLLPVQLGMSFYDKDEKLETKYISTAYRSRSQWPLDGVQISYTMESGKTYTAYPTVKIMGKELRATPSADFPSLHTCPDENHPHAIDLGLPSGTKWSCCNVGASQPEGYGGYYAWGETNTKNEYSWDSYHYGDARDNQLVYIGSDIAGTQYDAATVNWGAPWQMPSQMQIKELVLNTSSVWTDLNGIPGRCFIGVNGNKVFFPAAGSYSGSNLKGLGYSGTYWSSTLDEIYTYSTFPLYFRKDVIYYSDSVWGNRHGGHPVRPVR